MLCVCLEFKRYLVGILSVYVHVYVYVYAYVYVYVYIYVYLYVYVYVYVFVCIYCILNLHTRLVTHVFGGFSPQHAVWRFCYCSYAPAATTVSSCESD